MKTYSREWECSAKYLRFARAWKNSCVCDENLLVGMKKFRETLTFCETSRKILDIYVSAALNHPAFLFCGARNQEIKKGKGK